MNEDLTCTEVEELLPAFSLNALRGEERISVLVHLAECRVHDDELNGYRAMTARLPEVLEPMQPPTGLRDDLLTRFDQLSMGKEDTRERPVTPSPRSRLFQGLRTPSFAYGLAAIFLALAVGLGALAFSQGGGGSELEQFAVTQDDMQMRLIYLPDQQLAILNLDMPSLPANRTYQAWQVRDGTPVSLGVLPAQGTTSFEADLSGANSVAISIEPLGGSVTPSEVALVLGL